jgi:hypothetical protein
VGNLGIVGGVGIVGILGIVGGVGIVGILGIVGIFGTDCLAVFTAELTCFANEMKPSLIC